jgi:prepilin-type N-terminal cleavage/methylation domain-containing protein
MDQIPVAKNSHAEGYTLIELSVVLVIVGLLLGGIIAMRSVLKAAQIQSQITQIEQLNNATSTFSAKYNCLPGDCINYALYGLSAPPNTGGTNNDLGDGYIDGWSGALEEWAYYQHLSQASLIGFTPSYSSIGGSITSPNTSDQILLHAKIGAGLIHVLGGGLTTSTCTATYNKNYFVIAKSGTNFSAVEAFGVDNKIDDGFPTTGLVVAASYAPDATKEAKFYGCSTSVAIAPSSGAGGASNSYCVSTSTTPNSYNTLNSAKLCDLMITTSF